MPSRQPRPTFVPTALLAAALLVAALAPAAAATNDEIANLTGPDRRKILEEGAKKEGTVLWYTTLIVDQAARPMADDFAKKTPFVKIEFVRMESSQLLQRVMAESRARSVRGDVVSADVGESFKALGLAQAFRSPIMDEYPAVYRDPDRQWVQSRTSWQGIAWNTDKVPDDRAPKTWEALLDPKWKGQLAWAASSGTGAPRVITHFRKIWGEDKALDYLNKLKAQDIRTLPGSVRTVLDQVIAGEKAIGVSMSLHHIAISKAKGAPVFGTSPEPALARREAVAMLKNAPHPHAAMVLLDYLMAKDGGQLIMREAQYNPAHPAVEPLPELRWTQPNLNDKKELLLTQEEEDSLQARSAELYKSVFR